MRFCGLTAIALLVCALAHAQEGSTTNPTEGPPYKGWTTLMFYTGTNMDYVCQASSPQPQFQWSRSDDTLTSIDDAAAPANTATITTATPHGLVVGNQVNIRGATVDTDLNGSYYVQSTPLSTSFTVTTVNVTDASYTESGLNVITTAPRTSSAIWSIQKLRYDGSNNLISKQWAGGNPGAKFACDNRAVTTGTTKVTYQ